MSSRIGKFFALVLLALSAVNAQAALVSSTTTTITTYYTYADFGSGDVIFMPAAPPTGCESGFWLRPTDAGFKTLFTAMLLAYSIKSPVVISGHDDQLWGGSSGHFCRVDAIFGA